ncbi:SPSB3 protein, partial [Uria aalge]|nr:SPSB3 protein [Uria aalge]
NSMARRTRSSRAWHFVLSGVRREADTRAVALATGAHGWGYDSDGQHSDSDSEPEFSSLSPSIPSAIPVTGESYCNCENQSEAPYCSSLHALHRVKDCQCGEEDECKEGGPQEPTIVFWGLKGCSPSLVAQTALLHRSFALRGGPYLCEDYKHVAPVMFEGLSAELVNASEFTSGDLLSNLAEATSETGPRGYSLLPLIPGRAGRAPGCRAFGQGSIIGVHLDTWHGTLTFFKNRKCIGVAATKLQNKKFYPMVCSTAAKSSMKVIRSCASCTSLQYLCCYRLRQLLPDYVDTLEVLPLPPGLKQVLHNKLGWVLSMNYSTSKPSSSSSSGSDSDSSCGSDAEACQRKRCRRT